eukprot:scaffold5035_cov88-Skeletonema_dohrnii-CCMP3373.AAC.4
MHQTAAHVMAMDIISSRRSCIATEEIFGGDRPTKPHRVGGETAQQEQEQEPEPDAFSRYSSNLYRMKALLLCSEDDEGDDDLEAVGQVNGILRSAGLSDLLDTNRLGNANADDDDASSKRRRGNDSQPIQQGHSRKTRISFELHPHLILHDLFAELDMAESAQAISDDELELEDEKQPSQGQGSTKPNGKKES